MKNLKKSLALVLAIVMVFSLVVFANAEFADADQIAPKYKDACGVMNGLGILKGDQNGNFMPQGTLKRDQAAKIIAYLKMGKAVDTLPANQVFDDVPADHWAAKYVAYCSSKNIINGDGTGKFNPDQELSGYAFGKMLLVAIGYGQNGEYVGPEWAIHVAEDAAKTGLFKGLENALTNDPISREVAAQLAFTALGIEMVDYAKSDDIYKGNGKTLAETVQDLNLTPVPGATDLDGRPTKTYTNLAGTKVIYEAAAEPIATITDGSFDTTKAPYKDWDFSKLGTNGIFNREDNQSVSSYEDMPGETIEFYGYADKDGVVYITNIVGTDYEMAIVKSVDANKVELNIKGSTKTFTKATEPKSFKLFSAFAKDDVLCINYPYLSGDDAYFIAEKAEALTGEKVTARDNVTFTLDGAKKVLNDDYYDYANDITDSPALGAADGTFYLDPNGCVIGFVGTAAAPEVHTYVYAVAKYDKTETIHGEYGDTTVTTYYVQTVSEAGEIVNYQTADNTYGGFTTLGVYEVKTAYNNTLKVDVATFTKGATEKTENVTVKATDKKTAAGTYFDTAVKFIFVTGSKETIKIVVKDGVQTISTAKDIYYHANKVDASNEKAVAIFVDGTPDTAPSLPTGIAFVYNDTTSTSSALVKDGTGKDVTGYAKTVYIDGEKKDIYVAAAAALADGYYEVKANGDLSDLGSAPINVAVDPYKGVYFEATAVTNNAMGYLSTANVTDLAYANAKFVNLTANPALTADKLSSSNQVALVLNAAKTEIAIIYVVA